MLHHTRSSSQSTYLSIKCSPLAVDTTSLSSPTLSVKATSSNSICISPRPKYPKSPRLRADEQSDSVGARSPSVEAPDRIVCSWTLMISKASSLVRVISAYVNRSEVLVSSPLLTGQNLAYIIYPYLAPAARPSTVSVLD
jgi:hypothetical protein